MRPRSGRVLRGRALTFATQARLVHMARPWSILRAGRLLSINVGFEVRHGRHGYDALSRVNCRPQSTLLEGLRSRATCRNADLHSGECKIHGKDGVAGSITAGGSTHVLTSGNAGASPSGADVADHIRTGMGCEGSRAVRALTALLSSNVGRGVSGMARFWAGRIAVTEHIPGPSTHERRSPRSRQVEGHADPGVASGWAAGLDHGRDRGSPGRFMDGRPWVRSVRGCIPPAGEWSGRAARNASRD
jgi:hypothetical protein